MKLRSRPNLIRNEELVARFARSNENWSALAHRVGSISKNAPQTISDLVTQGMFVPAGQILRGAGDPSAILFNSFVVGPENAETIQQIARRISSWTRRGCGVGINISPFLHSFDANPGSTLEDAAKAIGYSQQLLWEEGIRRTATMINLEFGVSSIRQFSESIANDPGLRHLNVGVVVDDASMTIAEKPTKSSERSALEESARAVWTSGNPGFIFSSRVNEDSPFRTEIINSCNSCAEQHLAPNEGAPLGSINLPAFISANGFDFASYREVVRLAVRFLNDVIDATAFPSQAAEVMAIRRRRIGLGVMGYDSTLHYLGLQYDSSDALEFAEQLAWQLRQSANEESEELAKRYGPFDDFPQSTLCTSRRNCALLSIAPTGAISSLWGVSSGIEPLFGAAVKKECATVNMNVPHGAHSISPPDSIHWLWHVHTLSSWQRYIDGGISKTVMVPARTHTAEILRIVIESWRLRVKSISIFREGSRQGGVCAA